MYANYHTHTWRCGHAVGSDREYVEAAIHSGIKILGFSDHCPWVFPDGYASPIRMIPSQLDEYFSSLSDLRKEYAGDITIYIGLEAEYIPELMEEQDRLLSQYPLDYMILGQHYICREPLSVYTGRATDSVEVLTRYVDLIIEGMNSGRYAYVAHPDLIRFNGDSEVYRTHMTRLCQAIRKKDLPIELNMLGADSGRNYPNPQFLGIAREVGCSAIIAADAHHPEVLRFLEGEGLCLNLAHRFGLPLVDTLTGLGEK